MKPGELNAYLGGIIDGEGWITIYKGCSPKTMKTLKRVTPNYQLVVGIANDDKDLLDFVTENYGGRIYVLKRKSYTIQYNWRIHGKEAEMFLKKMRRYIFCKRKVLDLALEFRKTYEVLRIPTPQDIVQKRDKIREQIMRINSPWRKTSND